VKLDPSGLATYDWRMTDGDGRSTNPAKTTDKLPIVYPVPDLTGRCHDRIPDKVPEGWGRDTVREALEAIEKSINKRQREIQEHIDKEKVDKQPGHEDRIVKEKRWADKLRERLRKLDRDSSQSRWRDFFETDPAMIGGAAAGGALLGVGIDRLCRPTGGAGFKGEYVPF
jgi:hypothetical protein